MNYINQLIITIFQIPMILIELYRLCGFWGIGSLFTLNITEIAKFQIGRLRPHFIAACNITLNEALCFEPFPNATDVIEGSETLEGTQMNNLFKTTPKYIRLLEVFVQTRDPSHQGSEH